MLIQPGNEIPVELIQTVLKMWPTMDEESKLKLFTGDISQLGPAERFLKALVDIPLAFKRLAAMHRVDKYPAMAVLVKIINQTRSQTLLEIVDSHHAQDILSDVKILRSSHGATGLWLDQVERLLSTRVENDNVAYVVLNGEVSQYASQLNALTKMKEKIDAHLDEIWTGMEDHTM
ncbi:formin protein [Trifolium repens]|jgi:hypothetical protein|nr:formin protein [Trifolium repens]